MNFLYSLWIRAKYQYYKLYWKIFPPKRKRDGFYGWQEIGCSVLDQKAVGIGIIDKKLYGGNFMNLDELLGTLKEKGDLLANIIFKRSFFHLEALDLLYNGRLCEAVEKDKGHLGQPSANFGHPRQIMVEESLNEIGIDASAFEGLLDLLILKNFDAEVKGSFTKSSAIGYNDLNGGKLHILFGEKLHFILQHKIEVYQNASPTFVSMRLIIAYINSSMFENIDSDKQNRSVLSIAKLRKNYQQCIIGEWEVFKTNAL